MEHVRDTININSLSRATLTRAATERHFLQMSRTPYVLGIRQRSLSTCNENAIYYS